MERALETKIAGRRSRINRGKTSGLEARHHSGNDGPADRIAGCAKWCANVTCERQAPLLIGKCWPENTRLGTRVSIDL